MRRLASIALMTFCAWGDAIPITGTASRSFANVSVQIDGPGLSFRESTGGPSLSPIASCPSPSGPCQLTTTFDCAAQCLLRLARDSKIDWRPIAQPAEPPYADPHVLWCGRGGAASLPPIPIVLWRLYFRRNSKRSAVRTGKHLVCLRIPDNLHLRRIEMQ